MRTTVLLLALALLCTTTFGNESEQNVSVEVPETTTEILRTESRRNARQLNIPGQEYVVRGHSGNRQVIKIPNNAKLKVLQPPPPHVQQQKSPKGKYQPQQQPPKKQPYSSKYQQSSRPKRPFDETEDEYYDDTDYAATAKKPKRTKTNYMVRDVSPEEFYNDSDDYEVFQKKPKKKSTKTESPAHRNPPKKYRKTHNKYSDTQSTPEKPERRPHYDEETGYDFTRPTPPHRYKTHHETSHGGYHDDGAYSYHDYTAASSITMKQVPPPNLAPRGESHQEIRTEHFGAKKQNVEQAEHTNTRFEDYYQNEQTPVRKAPSPRQIHSMFPQQYTTHNPFTIRNIGVDEQDRSYQQQQEENYGGHFEPEYDHHQVVAAASEHRPAMVPTGSSGIHIVNPPQFIQREHVQPTLQTNSQRATIRDILRQDCPDAERVGYCASPPRYPTQQINTITKRCADILDAMYSPAPLESEDDLTSFSSRSDEMDIEFTDTPANITNHIEQNWSQWSRSSSDGSNTVCYSAQTLMEPGYAREITSGRWFVIMQTLDHIVQRIMTDTCERPGKPCGGLAGLKCSKTSHHHHGFKATRCIQRYSQQRLISWDPEVPQSCPKVRIFKFPTACLCHLSAD